MGRIGPLFPPPIPVARAPGPLAGFLRLLPLFSNLYRLFYLLVTKGPLGPPVVGGDVPQGPLDAPPHPAVVPLQALMPPL